MRKTISNPQPDSSAFPAQGQAQTARTARPDAGARGADPLTYTHRYDSMRRFAELLALR
ncbi:MAG: hypothetical protein JJT96_10015 [Opitutales bacterium]|nr:hypothetical protein [Opitutales bacterium]